MPYAARDKRCRMLDDGAAHHLLTLVRRPSYERMGKVDVPNPEGVVSRSPG